MQLYVCRLNLHMNYLIYVVYLWYFINTPILFELDYN